ncbi:3994_t:CDS:2 [Cetraspora pellucida]|uniref:3994_t:CDS:1 n=1 Tax=Cetraspora pellucida TaxID=1433469 RepID=A0A9N9DST9_9GLOM|nr:3994_t:CDS:2 [Cetraspora pellucida]
MSETARITKKTDHVLQNSHVEYDNNKTQDTSYMTKKAEFSTENPYTKKLSLEMNLDNEKAEQPKAEIEANSSFPNNKEIKQPRTETEMNNSAKSTQFMFLEKTIQKKAALNIQKI